MFRSPASVSREQRGLSVDPMTRLRIFDELNADIRYGLRSLFKSPLYALVAVLSLALGIGATEPMLDVIVPL